MECKNLLITKNNLIEHCGIASNADDASVNVAIVQAHNTLKSLICRDYYDFLISGNDAGSLTGYHLTLLNDYIEYYLTWLAYSKFILLGAQMNARAGFREHIEETSQPVTEARLNALRKNAEEQVMYYKAEMFFFINGNIAEFSLYKNSDCYDCTTKKESFKITGAGSYE